MGCNCGKSRSSTTTTAKGTTTPTWEVVVNGRCVGTINPNDPTECRGRVVGGIVRWRDRVKATAQNKARTLKGLVRQR